MTKRLIIAVLFSLVGWAALSHSAKAATLYFSPGSGSHKVGQTFSITLKVNAAGQAINAAEGTVTFPTDILQVKSVSKNGSLFKFWAVEPNGSQGRASILFSGGLPHPGYAGSSGTIAVATFVTKAVGKATIRFSGGKVLANDGQGTDVLTGQGSATITVVDNAAPSSPSTPSKPATPSPPPTPGRPTPSISSSNYIDQQSWYRADKAVLNWTKPSGMEGVSYSLTSQEDTVPDDIFEPNTGRTEITIAQDGRWYFHLKARYASGWSTTAHYRLQRDTVPPEPFTLTIEQDRGQSDPSPVLTFSTTDAVSGVVRYALVIDEQPASDVTSPHTLALTKAGAHTITVTAFDGAGNSQKATRPLSVEGYPAPIITFLTSPLLLLDDLVVKGTAQGGDTVVVSIDGQELGRVQAGKSAAAGEGVSVRAPWAFTSDALLRPGTHQVTAVVVSADGQTSVASDPTALVVTGRSILFQGRPIATVSLVPVVGVFLLSLVVAVVGVFIRLMIAVYRMHRREEMVDDEVRRLRGRIRRGRVSNQQLDASLEQIEQDLVGHRHRSRSDDTDQS